MKKTLIASIAILLAILCCTNVPSIAQVQTTDPQPPQTETAQKAAMSSAHCNCKVVATPLDGCGSTKEVFHESKGGYMGCPLCKPKCKDYCRGVWDATTAATKQEWAKQASACGTVKLEMFAACATCDYDQIGRSENINLGGKCVTVCDCEPGYNYDPNDGNCKRSLCAVPGVPNQGCGSLFVWGGVLYQIGKKFNCRTFCK